jgi:hypothetical protein
MIVGFSEEFTRLLEGVEGGGDPRLVNSLLEWNSFIVGSCSSATLYHFLDKTQHLLV